MQRFYPMIASGVILFYIAVGFLILMYAFTIRLDPAKVKIRIVNGLLKKMGTWLR